MRVKPSASILGLAEDTANSGVGILQVGGGVALEGQHGVPVKNIIIGSGFAQIGIFDRANTHLAGNHCDLLAAQIWVFFADQLLGSLYCFHQQIGQFDCAAGAGFKRLAIWTHHGAKGMVLKANVRGHEAGFATGNKDLLHMQGLAGVNKVQNAVCLQGADSVSEASQIAGGVEKTAAGLLHNHGRGIAIFVGQFVEEHHFGAFGVDGQALLYQGGQYIVQIIVVGALGGNMLCPSPTLSCW